MTLVFPSHFHQPAADAESTVDTINPGCIFSDCTDSTPYSADEPSDCDNSFIRSSLGKMNEPETPMRRARGRSASHMITPQSVGRSFSTSSLPFTPNQEQMMYSSDAHLDTPIDYLHNSFSVSYDPMVKSDWNFNFNFSQCDSPVNTPMNSSLYGNVDSVESTSVADISIDYPRSLLADTTFNSCLSRSTSVSGSLSELSRYNSESDSLSDDSHFGSLSFNKQSTCLSERSALNISTSQPGLSSSLSAPETAQPVTPSSAGTNPFYRPPPFLRKSTTNVPTIASLGGRISKDSLDAGVKAAPLNCRDNAITESVLSDQDFPSSLLPRSNESLHNLEGLNPRKRSSSSASQASEKDCEKPFCCELCSKSFRRMEHLRRHAKTHTLERPYQCTVPDCGRRFSRTDNLKAHILTHTKKCGRNAYVEGLSDSNLVKPIKRRKPKKTDNQATV